ncbi:centromere protein J [Planococcus citri]|uniref:centromere protein J n=1 Tax=Planococcus citri TaxID=170843 RepID=UPI0031F9C7A7
MASSSDTLKDAGQRLLTIRQQINNLRAWNKSQENKLISQKPNKSSTTDEQRSPSSSFNEIEEQPLAPVHRNFEALLNAKLNEERYTKDETTRTDKPVQKRAFLKKGKGLTRFRMKPEDFKLNQRKPSTPQIPLDHQSESKSVSSKSNALEAFEALEEQANNSSFCSTSSMVEQLMEDSIKSTPVKIDDTQERYLRVTQEQYACRTHSSDDKSNYEFFGIRRLDIIDEEPSRFDESSKEFSASECNLIINRSNVTNEYSEDSADQDDDDDQSSKCSCCDNSRFLSASVASVSVYEETTTVYTPIKSTLQTRLKELESEIDAFRSENAHLTQLRSEYETEYKKFCDEKTQILSKIREEHLTELKELEQEKKKLQREKFAFEKYIKDSRNRPNKEEKEEMRLLKEEIKSLKQKLNEKESRWAAAQARIRSEMKQLKDHNSKLKDEVDKLRKSSKNTSVVPVAKKSKSYSNILSKIDVELEKTQKIVEKYKTPPSSPDSGVDTFEETKIDELSSELPDKLHIGDNDSKNDDNPEGSKPLEICNGEGNREKFYADGRKEIWYPNGNVKKVSADGKLSKTIYYNGDVKEISTDLKMVKYFYAESKIWLSEYENGLQIIEFPNGQVEKRLKGESVEVVYPNGTIYSVTASGDKVWVNLDGTTIVHYADRDEKKIFFPNKQVETHTTEFKKREYPDGTIKTIYVNGIQETKYPNGRVRLKTKDGRLLSDSEVT